MVTAICFAYGSAVLAVFGRTVTRTDHTGLQALACLGALVLMAAGAGIGYIVTH